MSKYDWDLYPLRSYYPYYEPLYPYSRLYDCKRCYLDSCCCHPTVPVPVTDLWCRHCRCYYVAGSLHDCSYRTRPAYYYDDYDYWLHRRWYREYPRSYYLYPRWDPVLGRYI